MMRSIRTGWIRGMAAMVLLVASPTTLWASVGLVSAGIAPDSTPSPAPVPPHTGLLPISPLRQPALPAGSVLCGVDSIFNDGFESASFTPVGQLGGGMASPGLAQDITGPLTSIIIASPSGTTGDATVDVTGSFVGPVNTGVTVNGIAGYVVNGHFLVPNVLLNPGANTLNVEAATLPGATASASGSIMQSGAASLVSMQADRATGYAPSAISFHYTVGALPGNATVQSVSINFRGSGADDYTGSLSGAPSRYTYTQPGLYTAHLTVTDSNSQTYTGYRAVLIQDLAAQRGMLCDVYGYVTDRLAAQDAASAGNAFQAVVRSDYVSFFNQLAANMPATAQQLGTIIDGQLGTGFADLLLVRDNPDQTRSGFPLRLTQGADGVWRISEM
ncbi:hypothetical protein [Dokdonella soli]|uniref:hypothetical protein n=1 Tax=Dokdonella soli TaxID=529810 RepID=UPI00360E3841